MAGMDEAQDMDGADATTPRDGSWDEEDGDDEAERERRVDLGEALYGVVDFRHVGFNKRVGLLLEGLFPGEVHRRTLKVDRVSNEDALPINGAHVRLITGLINRMAFKDALAYHSSGLKIHNAGQVSQQIRKYTYRKRKAYEFSRLPAAEQERIKKSRQDKAKRLRQIRDAAQGRFSEN